LIIVLLVLAAGAALLFWGSTPSDNVLSDDLSVPLNGATNAKIDINSDSGHLTIDKLTGGEQAGVLASGTLQYFEKQGLPARSVSTSNGQAIFTLKGGGTAQAWFTMPWSACGGAYDWQIHLNPGVQSDITAHSGGGNLKLNLAGMAVTRVSADSGGGNMDVVLPDNAANLDVLAKTGGGNVTVQIGSGTTGSNTLTAHSGAGNVTVYVPEGVAARVRAHSGIGKIVADSRFTGLDKETFQSAGYDSATNRVEINADTGAGDVIVKTK